MPKKVNRGKTKEIIDFIRQYTAEHGAPPTVREIGVGVGLRSNSTVHSYLQRMEQKGLITSTTGMARSVHVVEPLTGRSTAVLNCRFHIPAGTFPISVFATVSDGKAGQCTQVKADQVEVLQSEQNEVNM